MSDLANRPHLEPGPDHPISVEPTGHRVVVRVGGTVVADSEGALTLREASYPAVHYVPLADVDEDLLRATGTSTYCPFKGDASYWSLGLAAGERTDAVWGYPEPHPAVAAIAGHVAFDPTHAEVATA